jgi:hypothetical protein
MRKKKKNPNTETPTSVLRSWLLKEIMLRVGNLVNRCLRKSQLEIRPLFGAATLQSNECPI